MIKSSIIDAFLGVEDGAPAYDGIHASAHQGWLAQDGLTVELEPLYGSGAVDYVRINESLVLALADFRTSQEESRVVVGKSRVKFNFQLSGHGQFRIGDGSFETLPMTGGIMLHPEGVTKIERYPEGESQVCAIISCDIDYLSTLLGPATDGPGEALHRVLSNGDAGFLYSDRALTLDMVATLRALFDSRYQGRLRKLDAEARVLDLLCQFCRGFGESDRGAQPSPLSARDRERVETARRMLEHDFVTPPSTLALAHALGTNEAKLSNHFKQAFGATIFDYIQSCRMERARHLLTTSDLSITQIAYEMGYEYPGNFTTAFKRYFSMTPRQVRKGHS